MHWREDDRRTEPPQPADGWRPAIVPPPLARDEIHVWRLSLDVPGRRIDELRRILDDDERARGARFHFERDRCRFVVARAVLRLLLARYLNCVPETLRFLYGKTGKPSLAPSAAGVDLRFNLSHSEGLALYAISRGREVGIDIEYLRADVAIDEIAARFFSSRERVALEALAPVRRREAFFACWTRKEAYVKARGDGLSLALDAFDVSVGPDESPALLAVRGDPDEVYRWSFAHLAPAAGYVGTVVIEGTGAAVTRWEWGPL